MARKKAATKVRLTIDQRIAKLQAVKDKQEQKKTLRQTIADSQAKLRKLSGRS